MLRVRSCFSLLSRNQRHPQQWSEIVQKSQASGAEKILDINASLSSRGIRQYSSYSESPISPYYDPDNSAISIARLPAGVNEEDLRSYFSKYGDVVEVQMPPSPLGEAVVRFSSGKEMFKALAEVGHKIRNQVCEVVEAKHRTNVNAGDLASSLSLERGRERRRVFVGRIPEVLDNERVRQHFAQFGQFEDYHQHKHSSRENFRCVFVIYKSAHELAAALSQDKHLVEDMNGVEHELNVVRARPREARSPSLDWKDPHQSSAERSPIAPLTEMITPAAAAYYAQYYAAAAAGSTPVPPPPRYVAPKNKW